MDQGQESSLVTRLRQAVQDSGQSLNQLSATSGIDRDLLARFVRGEADLTLAVAGRLCEVLGLELRGADRGAGRPGPAPATPSTPPAAELEKAAQRPPRAE